MNRSMYCTDCKGEIEQKGRTPATTGTSTAAPKYNDGRGSQSRLNMIEHELATATWACVNTDACNILQHPCNDFSFSYLFGSGGRPAIVVGSNCPAPD